MDFVSLALVTIGVGGVLGGTHWFLLARHPEMGAERRFPRQLVLLGLTIAGLLAIALALPVAESTRNQVIGLLGLLLSGMIAFSSTTVLANLMAGVMLRMTRAFRTGDYVRAGECFGRVTERGLFDTEIQTETRELIAVPNTYLASHPVTVVRSSGTVVSASLSLGYDVHHARVEPLLLHAAREAELEDPFVHVLELGNYAVTYRVSGLLTEVKALITTRSNLHRAVLDALHDAGIEIMSPTFMNQRPLPPDARVIPEPAGEAAAPAPPAAETVVFDKAEGAERQEQLRQEAEATIASLEERIAGAEGDAKEGFERALAAARERLASLQQTEA